MIEATEMSAEKPLGEHRGETPSGHPGVTTVASLVSSEILPAQIDVMKIDTGDTDLEVIKGLTSVRPAVVQIEFSSEDVFEQRNDDVAVISASERIMAMRDLEYYWNIIVFRGRLGGFREDGHQPGWHTE